VKCRYDNEAEETMRAIVKRNQEIKFRGNGERRKKNPPTDGEEKGSSFWSDRDWRSISNRDMERIRQL
jgi:hypothetical protein